MLTLIKVPGKRKRKLHTDNSDGESNKRPRPTGRPRKVTYKETDVSTTLSKMKGGKRKSSSLENIKAKWTLTALERLPTELLERIFLFSLNFNLPRSSPVISVKLSNQHLYITTALAVFDPTWRYTFEHSNKLASDAQNRQNVPGDPDLQSSLLRCRWATVSLIRQTEKKWLHKVAPKLTANPIEGVVNSRHHSSTFELEQYTHARYTTSQKVTSYDSEYNHFEADYAEFLHLTQLGESGEEIMFIRPPFRWETPLGIHPQTEIPESLLRGPWSPDMVMYLFWLTRAGVSIDYSASTSGEVARNGLDQAISDSNLQILFLLSCLGIEATVHDDILESAVDTCCRDKKAVIARVFDILASKRPGESLDWDRWFDDIFKFSRRQSRNGDEKRQQRIWGESLVSYWQRILPRGALEPLQQTARTATYL